MSDFIMLLNTKWNKGNEYIDFAMGADKAHIYNRCAIESVFANVEDQDSLEKEETQHVEYNGVSLFAMGNLENSETILKKLDHEKETSHPYEAIIMLYLKYGISHTLNIIEGCISFILIDYTNVETYPIIYVARDPLGHVPLWILKNNSFDKLKNSDNYDFFEDKPIIAISTSYKYLKNIALHENDALMYKKKYNKSMLNKLKIKPFPIGSFICYKHPEKVRTYWNSSDGFIKYYNLPLISYSSTKILKHPCNENINAINSTILYNCLTDIVKKFILSKDKIKNTIYFKLDGDISSTLLLAIANNLGMTNCNTFACGPLNAPWFKTSKIIAEFFKTNHIEIIIPQECASNITHNKDSNIEELIANITSEYLSSYTNIKHVILPLGSHIWHQGDSKDIWLQNKNVRNMLYHFLSREACLYTKEFWVKDITTHTPYIDRKLLETWLSLELTENMHNGYYINEIWEHVNSFIPRTTKLDYFTDQTKYWLFLDRFSRKESDKNINPPCQGIHWDKNSEVSIFC